MADKNLQDILNYFQDGRLDNEYIELTIIGNGRLGQVICAKNRIDSKTYAIKQIPIDDQNEIEALKMIRGLMVWAKLDCYYFVQYRSSWLETANPTFGKTLHIQMDLCLFSLSEAISKLHNYFGLNNKQLLPELGYYIASELMVELVECVDYLHTMPDNELIIHRYIKPKNILIKYDRSKNRFVKLADFIKSVHHQNDWSDQTHTILKQQQEVDNRYNAPETQQNHPSKELMAKYGPKADVYSIGVVFQEIFNFDLNRTNRSQGNLSIKYDKLETLIENMLKPKAIDRLNCKDILDKRHEWALKFSEVADEIRGTVDINRIYDPNDNFVDYFLQTKLKYLRELNIAYKLWNE